MENLTSPCTVFSLHKYITKLTRSQFCVYILLGIMNEKFEAKDILLSQFSISDQSLTANNKSKYKHSCVSLGRYRIAIVNNIKESCFFSNYCAPLNSGSPKESKHQKFIR